jgi:hypothetical protein
MENEVVGQAAPEVIPPVVAPDVVETASTTEAPVSGEVTPEVKPEKTFTQAELDSIVAKEKAKVERRLQRQQERIAVVQPTESAEPQKPNISSFATVEEYDKAMEQYAETKVQFRESQRVQQERDQRARREAEEVANTHLEREEKAIEKYADYYQVTRNPQLPISQSMLDAIQSLPNGPDVAYHLGQNPQEASRIAQLPPRVHGVEMGRLAAKLELAPPAPKTSSAPEPIRPVGGKGGSAPVLDSTDPRSDKLSTEEWMRLEDKRLQAKYAQGAR